MRNVSRLLLTIRDLERVGDHAVNIARALAVHDRERRRAAVLTAVNTYTTDIDVRFRDIDAMGHVNNAVYATYIEQARTEYFRDVLDADLSPRWRRCWRRCRSTSAARSS